MLINGVEWEPLPGIDYGYDFAALQHAISNIPKTDDKGEPIDEDAFARGWHRHLLENSLWAITAFVMRVPCAFAPFWVEACLDVQRGPRDKILDVWARGHGKSTIITCALTIQEILKDREITACIFSYSKNAALKFFAQIKHILETSDWLKWCYPDVLWESPSDQAPSWSEDKGLFVRRRGFQKEPTLQASGLLEGMPTGGHFKLRIYDDIMVEDLADSPDQLEKLKERFDLSKNLGLDGGWEWVIGTPYHHEDIIQALRARTKPDGSASYHTRIKPATEGGEWNGKPVFISQDYLDELKSNRRKFSSQQLLNPTPSEIARIKYDFIKEVNPADIPRNLYKFMPVDPAGERKDRTGDSWGMWVIGVDPYAGDLGASDIYILDGCIEELSFYDALDMVFKMYDRNGRILQLGVEKVATSSFEVHVANALRSKGKHVSLEAENLVLLRPAGRSKVERIEHNLVWPLNNGKVHISKAIPEATRARLKQEMERFPYWRDDGLDALSYLWDMVKNYRFGPRPGEKPKQEKEWLRKWRGGNGTKQGWLVV
jgi:hypothetical protein